MGTGGVVVNSGRNIALKRLYGTSVTAVSTVSVGTGTSTPAVTDTGLQTAQETGIAINAGYPSYDTANRRSTAKYFLDANTGNGHDLTEVGEFNTDGTPVMFGHDVHAAVTKTTAIEITYVITHEVG
jgi:hypothetical protein